MLAGRGADHARRHCPQRRDLAQRLAQPGEPDRQLGSEHGGDPVADLVEAAGSQRRGHPPLCPEDVDCQRHVGAGRPVKQQRGPTVPDNPGDDLSDLQDRIDRDADVPQVAVTLEVSEERAQIRPGHGHHPCSGGHSSGRGIGTGCVTRVWLSHPVAPGGRTATAGGMVDGTVEQRRT